MGKRASSRQGQFSSLQEGLKRARRRKTPDDAPPLPSSTTTTTQAAQIHRPSRPQKRKAVAEDDVRPMPGLSSLSWGGKRSRTSVGRRDWSNLDDGPAGLIAERLLADDVADYIHFRAVCRPWRRCCSDPRSHAVLEDRRFHPRRWIMLLGENEQLRPTARNRRCRRHFLNVSTGKCIQVDIPEFRNHGVLRSTTQGLLLLHRRNVVDAEPVVRLLNPLTRQVAELPPLTTISGLDLGAGYVGGTCSPSSAGLVDDDDDGDRSTVVLYFHEHGMLAFAKPGDDRWVVVKTDHHQLMPTMSFAGRFYGVTTEAVMVVDRTTRADLPPRLVVAAKLARSFCRMTDTVHLVDNGGELLLVHRRLMPQNHRRSNTLTPHVFPSLSANTVYPGLMFGEREQIGAYHLKDASTETLTNNNYDCRRGLVHPWTIADCLAAYVGG
ncbi:hypothetical protein SORBI_3008G076100 [Sorghum bicolor]|uniref:KIB1-4 beta-propeller domain-containing protein n=1 Tax=Sorghum bicolor TaxID=4558 RepID=A0A1B6PC77_SORBI|nr:hypothetical protein SORBI_3008G076100 [Sorghum bicolor]